MPPAFPVQVGPGPLPILVRPLPPRAHPRPQEKSIMPDSLLQDLAAQEAADLLEFLQRLK